ncbi:SAV_915 family protein [Microbacterium phyllosphaerae]
MEIVAQQELPPVLYVPAEVADDDRARIAVRELANGQKAVIAYTALDRLHRGAGAQTPWMLLPSAQLIELASQQRITRLLLDVDRSGGQPVRRWGA